MKSIQQVRDKSSVVDILDVPIIPVIPFGIALPTFITHRNNDLNSIYDENDMPSLIGGKGIVGSIIIMGKKSAMIWVGWGTLDLPSSLVVSPSESLATAVTMTTKPATTTSSNSKIKKSISFGKGAPTMGQLVVAMPRTNYKGAFATGSKEASCSQLIGSASSEDQMLANQMASRLSLRSGMAIFVSCQLSCTTTSSATINNMESDTGLDFEFLTHRAAALTENEVWRILQEQQ
mmetsp:Transcript_33475/g.37348  ORF Transcript_33475/g.37348 Transcript_33475/m.37348 type:complete len:234 (+) Transcript_33475:75-776(+)